MQELLSQPYLTLYLSFWLLIELQAIGKYLSGNSFESVISVQSFPSWLKTTTLLFSNMFIVLAVFVTIIVLAFIVDTWYIPILGLLIGWFGGYILFSTKLLRGILGYRLIAIIGPAWIAGFIFFVTDVM